MSTIERRQFERFGVIPAYTACRARVQTEDVFRFDGHVHDLSEGGVRFEADIPIDPGTPIALEIELPERYGDTWVNRREVDGFGRAVFVVGNVVWCRLDDCGSALMAVAITRFCHDGDRQRLIKRLTTGGFARAISA